MSNYAIMRCAKLKSAGSVASSLKHNFREIETANADPERTPDNEHYGHENSADALAQMNELLPAKRRKDAVVCVEYLFTASPEWFKTASEREQATFFEDSMNWLKTKYGAENVITATVQRDETTPHLSAFVVPITHDGRLSAKEMVGDKAKMSADQTSYAEAVAPRGLVRGVKGSKAKHQSIKRYYSMANKTLMEASAAKKNHERALVESVQPQVTKKTLLKTEYESPNETARRVAKKHLSPMIDALAVKNNELKSTKQALEHQKNSSVPVPSNMKKIEAQALVKGFSDKRRAKVKQERGQAKAERNERGRQR